MSKIYKRNCDTCGKYYEKRGKYFCSRECMPKRDLDKMMKTRKKGAKEYYKKNRLKLLNKAKEYRLQNKDKLKKYFSHYYLINKKLKSEYDKKYVKKNRIKINNYVKNKKKIDIQFRLQIILRNRLLRALKKGYKAGSAVKDLGCSIEELKIYIENKFEEKMTWKNYGILGWHIDHKKPLSRFDLTQREQFLEACHYTNLQPMWASENIKKSNKII